MKGSWWSWYGCWFCNFLSQLFLLPFYLLYILTHFLPRLSFSYLFTFLHYISPFWYYFTFWFHFPLLGFSAFYFSLQFFSYSLICFLTTISIFGGQEILHVKKLSQIIFTNLTFVLKVYKIIRNNLSLRERERYRAREWIGEEVRKMAIHISQ